MTRCPYATDVQSEADIRPGDYDEECFNHPCHCIRVLDEEVAGISLVDGSMDRCCSVGHCGVRRLTYEEAVEWKLYGPCEVQVPPEGRWWARLADIAHMYRPRGRGGPDAG